MENFSFLDEHWLFRNRRTGKYHIIVSFFIQFLTPLGHSECIAAVLQPVEYLQKYSREQTTKSASDEMTYKLVKLHGIKEG